MPTRDYSREEKSIFLHKMCKELYVCSVYERPVVILFQINHH